MIASLMTSLKKTVIASLKGHWIAAPCIVTGWPRSRSQYKAVLAMGYGNQNRGVGLGFGATGGARNYSAAPPPKSLLKQCREQQAGLGPAAAEKAAAERRAADEAAAAVRRRAAAQYDAAAGSSVAGGAGSAAAASAAACSGASTASTASFLAAYAEMLAAAGSSLPPSAQAPAFPAFPAPPSFPPPRAGTAAAAAAAAAAPPAESPKAGVISMWVSTLLGASSQFSASDHSARQLLGAPAVFPHSGTSAKAWSAVPRPGESLEWVRVAFKRAVHPTAIGIVETSNPGSIVAIRGTDRPKGAQAADSDWFVLWSGSVEYPDVPCREFRPPLRPGCGERLVSALEITLDTREWTAEWWGEIDAIRLEGVPPEGAAGAAPLARSAPAPAAGAVAGTPLKSSVRVVPWLPRQLWESDRAYESRVRFDLARFGPAPPQSESEGMRRAALSMVMANSTELGCVYPAEVHASIEDRQGEARAAASGMAVEGQRRAEAEQRRMAQ